MGFWERATTIDLGAEQIIDLDFFANLLALFANDVVSQSAFAADQLALDGPALQELDALLDLMPATAADRAAWVDRVENVIEAARRYAFPELDSIPKVRAALGLA